MKSRGGKSQRREEKKKEDHKKRKSQKKEDPGVRKGRKVAKHYVFPVVCGSGGSGGRLAKAAGAEPAGQMRDEKLHTVVAQSTLASEKAKSTSHSDHFWKLRCRKSARRCGAKQISKSKCEKKTRIGRSCDVGKVHGAVARSTFRSQTVQSTPCSMLGPLLEVEMSKKCTLLWREAQFEVKLKTPHVRSTFGS